MSAGLLLPAAPPAAILRRLPILTLGAPAPVICTSGEASFVGLGESWPDEGSQSCTERTCPVKKSSKEAQRGQLGTRLMVLKLQLQSDSSANLSWGNS